MSRGIRSNTLDRIMVARQRDPLALGPILGELATTQQIPASLIAELVGSHEQTVTRWFFGQSEVQAQWLPNATKVLSLLLWRRMANYLPLIGSTNQRRADLESDVIDFKAAVKAGSRIIKAVA
jgi:hypothetical protein